MRESGVVLSTILMIAGTGTSAFAADEPKPLWDLKLGLSYVATSGNSDTSTAGVTVDYNRRFAVWNLSAFGRAVRATEEGATSAERYVAGARANYPMTPRLSLAGGLKAEKDRFAGFDLRTVADAGAEYLITDDGPLTASAMAGATWTREDPTVGGADSWLGALVGVKGAWKLSDSAEAGGAATFYPSFEESNDWRLEGVLGLQATLTDLLSLKVGWELRYDNLPVPGFKKTDTVTLVSLVLKTQSETTR